MAGLIDSLIDILEEQHTIYENLVGLGKEKKGVIIKNEIEELQKISSLENTLISQNNKLDKNRIIAFQDIAGVLNLDIEELTLTKLSEIIKGKPEYTRLVEITNKLKNILEELKQVNFENKQLIESALEFVEYSMNIYRGSANGEVEVYSSTGESLTPQRGFFDAKQWKMSAWPLLVIVI